MAKGAKKLSAKKPTAKRRLTFPVPPGWVEGLEQARREERLITRALAREAGCSSEAPSKTEPTSVPEKSAPMTEVVAPALVKAPPQDPQVWLTMAPTRFPTGPKEKRRAYFARLAVYMRKELGDNAWAASTIGARMYERELLPLRQRRARKSHRKSH